MLLAGRTAAERRRRRAGLRLRDFSITTKTRQRYEYAVGKVLPFLEKHQKLGAIDEILCEYVEAQWARGESVNFIADTLSGLHFFWPELRGLLREAWRLFKQWRRIEAPTRAPPITPLLVRAIVCRAVQRGDLAFATLVAVGFHALLRTGELLSVRYCDLEFNQTQGILSLQYSKSGLRTGTQEAVALRDVTTLQLLDTLYFHVYLIFQDRNCGQGLHRPSGIYSLPT